jgi:hypothetical protein
MKIPETYEEFLKTPKSDLLEISKMGIPPEVASRIATFISKAEDEYRKNQLLNQNAKRKIKQFGKICMKN